MFIIYFDCFCKQLRFDYEIEHIIQDRTNVASVRAGDKSFCSIFVIKMFCAHSKIKPLLTNGLLRQMLLWRKKNTLNTITTKLQRLAWFQQKLSQFFLHMREDLLFCATILALFL